MNLLSNIKEKTRNREKELAHLKNVTNTILESVQHASLLHELVHGNLMERLRKVSGEKIHKNLQIKKPMWMGSEGDRPHVAQDEGFVGKVVYNIEKISLETGRQWFDNLGNRYQGGCFVELFKKPLKQTAEIILDGLCSKITVTEDKILAPLSTINVLQVYTKDGKLLRTFNTEKGPGCVEKTHVGEFMLSCETGMFVLDAGMTKPPVKVIDGCYSDVCVFGKTVFSFDDNNKCIIEFVRDDISGWIKNGEVPVSWLKDTSDGDTLLVRECRDDPTELEFFICACHQHTVYQVNSQGQIVAVHGSKKEPGGGLKYPYLCGIDSEGMILVADSWQSKCKVLNTQKAVWSSVFTTENVLCDVLVVDENTVWFSRHADKIDVLSKYEAVL